MNRTKCIQRWLIITGFNRILPSSKQTSHEAAEIAVIAYRCARRLVRCDMWRGLTDKELSQRLWANSARDYLVTALVAAQQQTTKSK